MTTVIDAINAGSRTLPELFECNVYGMLAVLLI